MAKNHPMVAAPTPMAWKSHSVEWPKCRKVTSAGSDGASQCSRIGSWPVHRSGMPRKETATAPKASVASTQVMERGDSCGWPPW